MVSPPRRIHTLFILTGFCAARVFVFACQGHNHDRKLTANFDPSVNTYVHGPGPHPQNAGRGEKTHVVSAMYGRQLSACGTPGPSEERPVRYVSAGRERRAGLFRTGGGNQKSADSQPAGFLGWMNWFFSWVMGNRQDLDIPTGHYDDDARITDFPSADPNPTPRLPVKIKTYYHIVKSDFSPSKRKVEDQHKDLEKAFKDTSFEFKLERVREHDEPTWYNYTGFNSPTELDMKTSLREGGAETLNVYINAANNNCGYTYLPEFYAEFPIWDGVVVNEACFLGGPGSSLSHEVGHWLGLHHIFANGCEEPGDGVDDTPFQLDAHSDCPSDNPDTCAGGGPDDFHNLMDYTSASCRWELTAGQDARMLSEWIRYRAPS